MNYCRYYNIPAVTAVAIHRGATLTLDLLSAAPKQPYIHITHPCTTKRNEHMYTHLRQKTAHHGRACPICRPHRMDEQLELLDDIDLTETTRIEPASRPILARDERGVELLLRSTSAAALNQQPARLAWGRRRLSTKYGRQST